MPIVIAACTIWRFTVPPMRDALAELALPHRLLVALLMLLGLLMLPHLSNLSAAVVAFFYLALGWRLLAIRHPAWLPRRASLMLLTLGAIALVLTSSEIADGRLVGTALLVAMLGLKLLEMRTRRDVHVTIFLGYFLVLTQLLYNQSLWLAIYLFAGVAVLISTQIGLNRVRVDTRTQLRHGVTMIAAALPIAVVFFLLFPRLQAPLWGINTPTAKTGITDQMTLGDIGRLSRSSATAFRVEFFGAEPTPAQRYWRGPVLWETDGARWEAGKIPLPLRRGVGTTGSAASAALIDYEVTIEPTGQYWLFGLDLVTEVPDGTRMNTDYALINPDRINRRMTYRAKSDPHLSIRRLTEQQRQRALQLPQQVSSRVQALVDGWISEVGTEPRALVRRALDHFNREPFVYTLTPGTLGGDPVDRFLFESRRGFCEHYAGSFTLLMRLAGIPSRVVVGYQGGEKNPLGDHWIVRQSDAHAWSEIWLAGQGWTRVDPTAAVAPERIEYSIDTAGSGDDAVVFQVEAPGFVQGLWREAAWLVDAVDLGWHRWIVGFTAERQNSLLDLLGLRNAGVVRLALALLVGGGIAVLIAYLIIQLPRSRQSELLSDLWRRYRGKLDRAGIPTERWQGPDTIYAAAASAYPSQQSELIAITRLYIQLRYGRRSDPSQLSALQRRIRKLRFPRSRSTVGR
jgi:transglutaminase-like putative cysteine protease